MTTEPLHVLLVEPWLTGSHEAWARGWMENSRHEVCLVSQPGEYWRHRMVGSAVPMAEATRAHVERHGRPDCVVATDMLDLAGYLGLCRRELVGAAVVLYMHENQLTQPVSANGVGGVRDRHLGWTNWRSVQAADEVWFNSRWQQESMAAALREFLGSAPDGVDHLPLLDRLSDISSVHPVGCDLEELLGGAPDGQGSASRRPGAAPLVLWNHRWSDDKGLDRALRSMVTLAAEGVPFEVALVGDDDNHDPTRMDALLDPLSERIAHRGWLPRPMYRDLLASSDVVVASARQENFGISVVEAIAAGSIPVVPDALAFPETVDDPAFRYPDGRLTTALRDVLLDVGHWRHLAEPMRRRVARFDWSVVAPGYDDALGRLVGRDHPAEDR